VKAALDVHYESEQAFAACLIFEDWGDSTPVRLMRIAVPAARPYHAGRFFERELPALLAILQQADQQFETIVIDGFVHLQVGKGLGAHLYEALPYPTCVIGVAKSELKIAQGYVPVIRGRSRKPLYVSAIGCSLDYAVSAVQGMHGAYRIPTLLKLTDLHARGI
jgi:deoxyribonuclease V